MKYKVLGLGKVFTDKFGKEKRYLHLVYNSENIDGHGVCTVKVPVNKLPDDLKVGDCIRIYNDVFNNSDGVPVKYVSSVEIVGE